ncbi:hypothetical protein SB3_31360 [Methylobacterium radiotolerans]|nr:hypothetical protein SB3_31360 [Methylobacterium radiotolerans]
MAAHLEHEHRQREREADPEPLRHIDQLGVGSVVERDLLGLQRHAADRAAAGTDLTYLGVHRAGVDRAGRRRRLRLAGLEVLLGICLEALAAAAAAEQILLALVAEAVLGSRRVDLHAADRIDREGRLGGRGAVIMLAAAAGMRGRAMMMISVRMVVLRLCHETLSRPYPGLLIFIP